MEVMESYREHLCDERINFIHGSIVESGLPDASFDIVLARHVMHHLVGKDLRETRALQSKALHEMVRLCRPGGRVIIYEHTNEVPLFGSMVFYLSLLFNRWGWKIKSFETGHVVVGFLSSHQLSELAKQTKSKFDLIGVTRRRMPLRWKVTLLMAFVGDALIELSVE